LRLRLGFDLDFGLALGLTRSGSFAPPVSRFHSSKVSLEIFPSTSSSANFLRCARLLNGIFPLPAEMSPRQPGPDCVNHLPAGRQHTQRGERTPFDHGVSIHKYPELPETTTNHLDISP
jgi:hypothetical protein